jgi:hypothetical protein
VNTSAKESGYATAAMLDIAESTKSAAIGRQTAPRLVLRLIFRSQRQCGSDAKSIMATTVGDACSEELAIDFTRC